MYWWWITEKNYFIYQYATKYLSISVFWLYIFSSTVRPRPTDEGSEVGPEFPKKLLVITTEPTTLSICFHLPAIAGVCLLWLLSGLLELAVRNLFKDLQWLKAGTSRPDWQRAWEAEQFLSLHPPSLGVHRTSDVFMAENCIMCVQSCPPHQIPICRWETEAESIGELTELHMASDRARIRAQYSLHMSAASKPKCGSESLRNFKNIVAWSQHTGALQSVFLTMSYGSCTVHPTWACQLCLTPPPYQKSRAGLLHLKCLLLLGWRWGQKRSITL